MAKLVLIDGNSLANRAFYAVPQLTNKAGFVTNAIYGFCNMLLKVRKEEQPEYLMVAFDAGKVVFRHEMYEGYKGSRKSMPEELREQFPVLKELLSAMGIPQIEAPGFEADDLIGTLAVLGSRAGLEVLIITGDRDSFQLIDKHTVVLFTRKGISELERFDEAHLKEVYQLAPWQIVELKGLMGDSSDDIPGVPGVGEKTAIKLLLEHESVEGVLSHLEDYAGKKLGQRLRENQELARLSRQLAKIRCDVPVEVKLEDMKPGPGDAQARLRLFKELEFKGLYQEARKEKEAFGALEGADPASKGQEERAKTDGSESSIGSSEAGGQIRLFGLFSHPTPPNPSPGAARLLKSPAELEEYLAGKDGVKSGKLYLLPVFTGLSYGPAVCHSWACALEGCQPVYFLPQEAKEAAAYVKALGPALENSRLVKVFVDAKQSYMYLSAFGINPAGLCRDLLLMAYLTDPASPWRSLEGLEDFQPQALARRLKEQQKQGGPLWDGSEAAAALAAMAGLYESLEKELAEKNMTALYEEIEEPLARILASMEIAGVQVDPEVLREMGRELTEKIKDTEKEIFLLAGEAFNINSPKQLGGILYDKLGLPRGKKTKTGYSTDADTLEYLAAEYEIAGKILEYRQYAKLKSTYIDGLLAIMAPATQKIHTSFHQTITVTGRLSSTEPNLQNIPVRLEEGRKIRRAFVASPGCVLLSGDYSQIELRILAHLCGDENLQKAFLEGQDIHRKTAAEVFGLAPEEVTPPLRRAAKAVNFGLIYGISDFGLAQDLGIGRQEAKEYMERYFARYPKVRLYFDQLLADAGQTGYVETLFHRRRYLPELKSSNYHTRAFGQRAAMNAPSQGTAADIMKLAMVKVYRLLEEAGQAKTMILQVHDELIFDMPKAKAEELKEEIRRVMEGAGNLTVPLQVDMKQGENWYNMEKC